MPGLTVGLLLAAGASRRFGAEDKLLAPFGPMPLMLHAAEAMRAARLDARLAVVSAPEAAVLLPDFDLVQIAPGAEQSASLKAGIRRAEAMGAARVVIVLADMPLITSDLISEIAERTGPACAGDGTRRMPPAAFPAEFFPELLKATGDKGAGPLLKDLPESAVIRTLPELLTDIDRPEELARLQKNA